MHIFKLTIVVYADVIDEIHFFAVKEPLSNVISNITRGYQEVRRPSL